MLVGLPRSLLTEPLRNTRAPGVLWDVWVPATSAANGNRRGRWGGARTTPVAVADRREWRYACGGDARWRSDGWPAGAGGRRAGKGKATRSASPTEPRERTGL